MKPVIVNFKLFFKTKHYWVDWCSWNKALIAWPNNTLNPLPSRHFKLCQIGFGMWTNILEPDSHMHALLPGSKLDTLGNCINSFRPPGNLMLTKRKKKSAFKIKISHSVPSQTQVKGKRAKTDFWPVQQKSIHRY